MMREREAKAAEELIAQTEEMMKEKQKQAEINEQRVEFRRQEYEKQRVWFFTFSLYHVSSSYLSINPFIIPVPSKFKRIKRKRKKKKNKERKPV